MKKNMNEIRIGDLVLHTSTPSLGIGIVTQIDLEMWGHHHEPEGVKVFWNNPTWHDPTDGSSVMYRDEVEVISEAR